MQGARLILIRHIAGEVAGGVGQVVACRAFQARLFVCCRHSASQIAVPTWLHRVLDHALHACAFQVLAGRVVALLVLVPGELQVVLDRQTCKRTGRDTPGLALLLR